MGLSADNVGDDFFVVEGSVDIWQYDVALSFPCGSFGWLLELIFFTANLKRPHAPSFFVIGERFPVGLLLFGFGFPTPAFVPAFDTFLGVLADDFPAHFTCRFWSCFTGDALARQVAVSAPFRGRV